MQEKKLTLQMIVCVLILAVVACNLPSVSDAANQNTEQLPPPENPENVLTDNAVFEEQPPPEGDAPAAAGVLPDFNLADPCAIVPASVVETFLGMPADPVPGPGVCVYSTGMISINIAVLQGEAAKLAMINEILQLENGCQLAYSYSSDQPEPTPIPTDAEYLLEMSTEELMVQSLDLQESCGGNSYETLEEYGPGVYLLPFELFMPGGMVSIAGEDYTLTILYIDMEQDAAASVEDARQILELIVSGE
jgi:hypothetical protein